MQKRDPASAPSNRQVLVAAVPSWQSQSLVAGTALSLLVSFNNKEKIPGIRKTPFKQT